MRRYLQEFSQKLLARTHEVGQHVEGILAEAKTTSTRAANVFNELLMLSNTQFIENVWLLDVSCTRSIAPASV